MLGQSLSIGQIYVRGIFVEHPHNIFPEFSEKVPYEIPGNIPNNVPGILNIGIFLECSMNILRMLHAFFLGRSRNTVAVFSSG